MSVTCPNGHTSEADDYCDVCGAPIDASAQSAGGGASSGSYAAQPGPAAPSSPAAAGSSGRSSLDLDFGPEPGGEPSSATGRAGHAAGGAAPELGEALKCPNCHAQNPAGALFCEACGYDFTTGAMPRGVETGPAAGSEQSTVGEPGEPPATPSSVQNLPPAASSSVQNVPPAASSSVQNLPPATPSSAQKAPGGTDFEWLAEVWVDPDWYRTQEAEDPCPSPGLPVIFPMRGRSVLLGRVSLSKNTHPEIDLSSDPGVSRRHAQLTTDGTRWFVEDLGSSNGTFVGPAAGPLPDNPIAVGPKTELGDDDRLYVGAWTRVVVRRATPDEVETYA